VRPIRVFKNLLRSFPWYSAFAIGTATGCAMAALGASMRIGNSIPQNGLTAWFGMPFFEALGLTPGRTGWMLVLEGTFLVAALCALAVRNHWGWWSTASAGMIVIIFFPGGTLAGIIVVLELAVRLIREKPWLRSKARAGEA
jgi:hypothetical protein